MKRVGRVACEFGLLFTLAVPATPVSAAEDNSLAFAAVVSLSAWRTGVLLGRVDRPEALRADQEAQADGQRECVSSRRSDPDNLLACDVYEGAIAVAAQNPSTLRCKLIGED